MTKKQLLKRISLARRAAQNEMNEGARGGGMFAHGLASDGFLGGYVAALDDVGLVISSGYPGNQHERLWIQPSAGRAS